MLQRRRDNGTAGIPRSRASSTRARYSEDCHEHCDASRLTRKDPSLLPLPQEHP